MHTKNNMVIEGTLPEMYEQGIRWLKSCLRRTQDGQSFNSIGKLEIPETVLEELLQNALVHIDLLKTAAIRLMVFDDRIEIVNPGCLVGGHTIEEVMKGNSFARNPLMAKFCAQTMPYRGLGSGIPRVLAEKSKVEFIDDKDGNQFTVRISRILAASEAVSSREQAVSKEQFLLAFCAEPRSLTEICEHLGLKDRYKVKKKYIDPLLGKTMRMTEPDSPNSPTQKYVRIS